MSLATVVVHETQFPGRVRQQFLESLRRRDFRQKFHYDSPKQTQKWLALHAALSPAQSDPGYAAAYEHGFETACTQIGGPAVHVVGLGCGEGEKDLQLLKLLRGEGKEVFYTAVDVSVPMVLLARDTALRVLAPEQCFPVVCDLPDVAEWETLLPGAVAGFPRVITFFGMMPTLNPEDILPQLRRLLRPPDRLLLSANLAPGPNYGEGLRRVLPQYDNSLTRDWLITVLLDAGFEASDGHMSFKIEENPTNSGLLRIQAIFHLDRPRQIRMAEETFDFAVGEMIRLFFSYRHTPALVRDLLARHHLQVSQEWLTGSGEEGVFLAHRLL